MVSVGFGWSLVTEEAHGVGSHGLVHNACKSTARQSSGERSMVLVEMRKVGMR